MTGTIALTFLMILAAAPPSSGEQTRAGASDRGVNMVCTTGSCRFLSVARRERRCRWTVNYVSARQRRRATGTVNLRDLGYALIEYRRALPEDRLRKVHLDCGGGRSAPGFAAAAARPATRDGGR